LVTELQRVKKLRYPFNSYSTRSVYLTIIGQMNSRFSKFLSSSDSYSYIQFLVFLKEESVKLNLSRSCTRKGG
jgi:CRISPR/Cas system endoribonuclease Cas6 (RAMP superfamily)